MPTIKLATNMANEIALDFLNNSNANALPAFGTSTATTGARLRIMSGAIPTQSEIDDAYPTWGRFDGSPTDILVEFPAYNGYFAAVSDKVQWDLASVAATATGTATWWIWSGNQLYDPSDRGFAPGAPDGKRLPCVIGTIGTIGGSPLGDLQLEDVDIVAGLLYEFGPLLIQMPREFTW